MNSRVGSSMSQMAGRQSVLGMAQQPINHEEEEEMESISDLPDLDDLLDDLKDMPDDYDFEGGTPRSPSPRSTGAAPSTVPLGAESRGSNLVPPLSGVVSRQASRHSRKGKSRVISLASPADSSRVETGGVSGSEVSEVGLTTSGDMTGFSSTLGFSDLTDLESGSSQNAVVREVPQLVWIGEEQVVIAEEETPGVGEQAASTVVVPQPGDATDLQKRSRIGAEVMEGQQETTQMLETSAENGVSCSLNGTVKSLVCSYGEFY